MSNLEDLKEFEEEIRLQSTANVKNTIKTRVDPDGTVMEWDESRKAWFPKIDDDFIAGYQMNYGVNTDEHNNNTSFSMDWNAFNIKLAQLRAVKGEYSEEVQSLTKAANDALKSYYSSPVYKEWYDNYLKQQKSEALKKNKNIDDGTSKVENIGSKVVNANKAKTNTNYFESSEDADFALARAEQEVKSGNILVHDLCQNVSTESGNLANQQLEPAFNQKRKQTIPPPAWYEVDESKNTHVYVSGLPPTITDDQFLELMSKCGVIMNEPFTNKPRIKLYRDEFGNPKGDGRCCYIKVESVDLALKILDGMIYEKDYVIHVERAKFQPKGIFDPKKRRRLTVKEKKKIKEQQENLFRWRIDTSKFIRGKKERVIVLKNVFYEPDFKNDVTLIPVVKERIRLECAKCGAVKKIVVHDANKDGVVTVTFSTPEEADTGLVFLNNALFDYPGSGIGAHQLIAERWDGKENFSTVESKDDEQARISNWKCFLGDESSSDEDSENTNGTLPVNLNVCDFGDPVDENIDQVDTDEEGGSSGADTS